MVLLTLVIKYTGPGGSGTVEIIKIPPLVQKLLGSVGLKDCNHISVYLHCRTLLGLNVLVMTKNIKHTEQKIYVGVCVCVCVCAFVYILCFCLLGLFIPRILNYKVCLLQATQAWLDASVCVCVCVNYVSLYWDFLSQEP